MWNKTYDITLFADSKSASLGINKKQENAYTYFKDNISDKQKEIEEILENYYGSKEASVLSTKFAPSRLFFSVNGRCALLGDDADDPDEGFAISIIPNVEIQSEEQYLVENLGGTL